MNDSTTDDESTPEPRRDGATSPWRRRMFIAAGAAAVIIATAIVIQSLPYGQSTPEDAVEGFLTAIADGDAELALEYVEYASIPTGETARFLDPLALESEWTVQSVRVDEPSPENEDEEEDAATVTATITNSNKTEKAEFSVEKSVRDGDWELYDPFTEVIFGDTPFDYRQANGFVVEPQAGREYIGVEPYLMFPGMYDFYADPSGVNRIKGTSGVAVLPDHDSAKPIVPKRVTPTKKTIAKAQKKFGKTVEACLASTAAMPPNCPFGSGDVPGKDDGPLNQLRDLTWRIETPPRISLNYVPDDEPDIFSSPGFTVDIANKAMVTLSGTGTTADGKTEKFTVEADIDAEEFSVVLSANGTVTLVAPDGTRT